MDAREFKRPSALQISSYNHFATLPNLDDDEREGSPASSALSSPSLTSASPATPAGSSLPDTSGKEKDGKEKGREKEKRKRSRVTPEQLVHLERLFAADRSPTAARRREIAEMLRMNERQTQIWFQNRRAKAKLLESKRQMQMRHSVAAPPITPPLLTAAYEREIQDVLLEETPITIIPAQELSIGSWRRIASSIPHQHDLIAYTSDARNCMTWYIQSGGYGFKMEIPFSSILRCNCLPQTASTAVANFELARPPAFYLAQGNQWRKCADWTEGMQASNILKHELIGSAAPLAQLVRSLNMPGYISPGTISLASLAPQPPPVTPTASLSSPTSHIPPFSAPLSQPIIATPSLMGYPTPRAAHYGHGRKRSYSGSALPDFLAAPNLFSEAFGGAPIVPPPTSYTPPADLDVISISQISAPRSAHAHMPSFEQQLSPHEFALQSAPLFASFPTVLPPPPDLASFYTRPGSTSLAGALGTPQSSS